MNEILAQSVRLQKYRKILSTIEYSQWKLNQFSTKSILPYSIVVLIMTFFVLIRLLDKFDELPFGILLGMILTLTLGQLILFLMQWKIKQLNIFAFCQHNIYTIISLIFVGRKEQYLLFICSSLIAMFQNKNNYIKLIILIETISVLFIWHNQQIIEVVTFTLLVIWVFIENEVQIIKIYISQSKLAHIIELMPNAFCIINSSQTNIVYANGLFENLAKSFTLKKNQREDESQATYLDFIHNLNMEQIKNSGFQISELIPQIDDEGVTDDQYKIVAIDFNNQRVSEFTTQSPSKYKKVITQKRSSNLMTFNLNKQQFLNFVERKSYTAVINLHMQLSHQPQTYVMSALTKRRKLSGKSSQKQLQRSPNFELQQEQFSGLPDRLSANLSPPEDDQLLSQQVNSNDILLQEQKQQAESKSPQFFNATHRVEFLINLIEINDLIDEQENLKIYCINELSPIILQNTVKKLEQVKKNILRSLSHELRTSLHAVQSFIRIARDSSEQHPKIQQLLNISSKYCILMGYKLQDFFDYRDILDEKFKLKAERFDLNTIVIDCVDLIREQCFNKKLHLDVDLPKTQIIVLGDAQKLSQVLLNLLTNSIKFTNFGGITVSVRFTEINHSSMQGFEADETISYVEIRIKDSGQGMYEEDKGKLMSKLLFIDQDSKISKDSVGVGVGLSVCQQIIKLMGPPMLNSLFLESIRGVGTQFYFYLNYCRQSQYKISDNEIPDQDNNNKRDKVRISPIKLNQFQQDLQIVENTCQCRKILLVDDEQFNIDILKYFIGDQGYELQSATNGVEAFQIIQTNQFKCKQCVGFKVIFMDINMPIMNGWNCAMRIRQFEKQLQLQHGATIIAITGFSDKVDQDKCISMGFDQVLLKPAKKQDILQILKKLDGN